jgi:hypothetical protein
MPFLLLSSGARAQYLEDIFRALALPDESALRFRYEEAIVSPQVRDLVSRGKVNGECCYLAYLDNRDRSKPPEIVPVREARIIDARKFGSSYIFEMLTARYVRTRELPNLVSGINNSVHDQLPSWPPNASADPAAQPLGYWVNFLPNAIADQSLIAHDASDREHLEYFEDSVRNLIKHADFQAPDRRLFFNVIRLADLEGRTLPLKNNCWTLRAQTHYRLEVYHYYPEEGTHAARVPLWLVTRAEGGGLSVLGGSLLSVDSEYDRKLIELTTNAGVRRSKNALSIYLTSDPNNQALHASELTFDVVVTAGTARNVTQALVIGVFAAIPGLLAAFAADKLSPTYAVLITVGGIAAGFASVFRFSRTG